MPRVALLVREAGNVPEGDGWLSPGEAEVLSRLAVPKRRDDFRLGRHTAKLAVTRFLGLPPESLATVEIRAAADGAPEAYRHGVPLPVSVSLSHAAGLSACAVAVPTLAPGCDLEEIVPRDATFVADFFTEGERHLVAQAPSALAPLLVNLLWSAKESAAKVLREGLRRDTRSLEVEGPPALGFVPAWRPIAVRDRVSSSILRGWWRLQGPAVLTALVDAPCAPPEDL